MTLWQTLSDVSGKNSKHDKYDTQPYKIYSQDGYTKFIKNIKWCSIIIFCKLPGFVLLCTNYCWILLYIILFSFYL